MKRIFFIVAALILGTMTYAQDKGRNFFEFHDGKVMIYQQHSQAYTPAGETIPFGNGRFLNLAGQFVQADGNIIQLQEGDRVTLKGEYIPAADVKKQEK